MSLKGELQSWASYEAEELDVLIPGTVKERICIAAVGPRCKLC